MNRSPKETPGEYWGRKYQRVYPRVGTWEPANRLKRCNGCGRQHGEPKYKVTIYVNIFRGDDVVKILCTWCKNNALDVAREKGWIL